MKFGIFVAFTAGLVCPIANSYSQDKVDKIAESILPVNAAWCEGSIMINDGTELKGLLRYNEHSGILSYENGDNGRTFTARSVAGFEFFDERLQKQRVFYSFPYEDDKGVTRPLFFEVIREFKAFAVLSKVDPLDIEHKNVGSPGGFNPTSNALNNSGSYGTTIEISQTETIYFMDAKGSIQPYVQIVETDIDGVFFDRTKTRNKMIDDDLLERHVGKEMSVTLIRYAKEKDLSFKRKPELIQILDHYAQLTR